MSCEMVILDALQAEAPLSVFDISAKTGIKKKTVDCIIRRLREEKAVYVAHSVPRKGHGGVRISHYAPGPGPEVPPDVEQARQIRAPGSIRDIPPRRPGVLGWMGCL